MTLPAPHLDDRRFQDLVDDAKRLVQQRCPEWSDHNVSDPGVTLIEAFATMVDLLLYRLNRVPERHYLRFLDLIGVSRFPPTAARTDTTFWLSSPQEETVAVPAGTQVATVRTEFDEPVTFTTTQDLAVVPCRREHVVTAPAEGPPAERDTDLSDGLGFPCFSEPPRPGDALLVGLDVPTPSCAVLLRMSCQVQGIGVDPRDPPLRWEAWQGEEWVPCEVDRDGTGGFNRPGDVVLHLPPGHAASLVAQRRAGWLRCLLLEPEEGQPFYTAPPIITELEAATVGGTVAAVHAEPVEREELGRSDGSAAQRFPLQRHPAVATPEPEVVEVGGEEGWQEWTLVEDFALSTAADRHAVLDREAGELCFGPAVRRPDGSLHHHGAVPPKGATIRLRRYATGGGSAGNVAARSLRVLKSTVPFVSTVENRRAAALGVDGETVAEAMVRGPLELRTRGRAVTAEDYELLARQAAPELARVHCVGAAEGDPPEVVRLLVVPHLSGRPAASVDFLALRPDPEVLDRVAAHLEPRRVLGARVVVEPPFYRGVTVVARLSPRYDAGPAGVRVRALAALYAYLHPLAGGPEGSGWPLGRSLTAGEVQALLQRVDGVDAVEDVRLFLADPVAGTRSDAPQPRVDLRPTELLFSFEHQVVVR